MEWWKSSTVKSIAAFASLGAAIVVTATVLNLSRRVSWIEQTRFTSLNAQELIQVNAARIEFIESRISDLERAK